MSYTPTNWNTGDTITAAAMNKIEQGIANAGSGAGGVEIAATSTALGVELDASYNDIKQILLSGSTPYFIEHQVNETPGEESEWIYKYLILTADYSVDWESMGWGGAYYVFAFSEDNDPVGMTFYASTATANLEFIYP